ncbi:MAG TPA: HAD-IIIA family hydrolase, partial [Longimicrobiales bacterium]|nr:HAD-IIIA family hydrolase [Longimicrobiales bacterium]
MAETTSPESSILETAARLKGAPNEGRPAAFLDRDGTIVVERNYLSDPEQVELIPGAAGALRALGEAGYALVIMTNQSGIARGLYTEAEFRA